MKKVLSYAGFIGTAVVNIWTFVSSQSYYQLAIAVVIYLVLVYYAYRLFIHKKKIKVSAQVSNIPKSSPGTSVTTNVGGVTAKKDKEDLTVVDIDKRAFLKLIGATGISFFLLSLLNRKIGTPILSGGGSGSTTLQNSNGQNIDPAQRQPTDSYLISEIDDGEVTYYGFTNPQGGWFIMREDTDNGTFRYVKGDANFQINWQNRQNLTYDYYYNVFQ